MNPREALARLAEAGTPPDAESALRISVGLDEKISLFRNETLPFLSGGGAELQFIHAPYGRGKTHLLWMLKEHARRQGFVTAYVDCATGQSPFASLRTTFNQIASNLDPPYCSAHFCQQGGIRAVINEAFSRVSGASIQDLISKIRKDHNLATDFRNLVVAYARSVLDGAQPDYLRQQLGALLSASSTVRVTMRELYRMYPHLPRPIGKLGNRNAASWVRSIASLPVSLGYPGLVVLFDETEKAHSMKKLSIKARREHLVNLRNLIDHMATGAFRGCAIYYAVVEEFLEIAQNELEALSQRIERMWLGTDRPMPNPRAVWVSLDELTDPNPEEPAFFDRLAEHLMELGTEAGLNGNAADLLLQKLKAQSIQHSNSINVGVVREFVKMAAGNIAFELSVHGG